MSTPTQNGPTRIGPTVSQPYEWRQWRNAQQQRVFAREKLHANYHETWTKFEIRFLHKLKKLYPQWSIDAPLPSLPKSFLHRDPKVIKQEIWARRSLVRNIHREGRLTARKLLRGLYYAKQAPGSQVYNKWAKYRVADAEYDFFPKSRKHYVAPLQATAAQVAAAQAAPAAPAAPAATQMAAQVAASQMAARVATGMAAHASVQAAAAQAAVRVAVAHTAQAAVVAAQTTAQTTAQAAVQAAVVAAHTARVVAAVQVAAAAMVGVQTAATTMTTTTRTVPRAHTKTKSPSGTAPSKGGASSKSPQLVTAPVNAISPMMRFAARISHRLRVSMNSVYRLLKREFQTQKRFHAHATDDKLLRYSARRVFARVQKVRMTNTRARG